MLYDFLVGVLSGTGWDGIKTAWRVARGEERIIYDGRRKISPADFKGERSRLHDTNGQPIGPYGEGQLVVSKNTLLDVRRTTTNGRFRVIIQRLRDGTESSGFIKAAPELNTRNLIVRFEAKASGGSHELRAAAHVVDDLRYLGEAMVQVASPDWKPYSMSFNIEPTVDARLCLDDQGVTKVGSVQIRRLLITEAIG